jgi:hypothetical protein
MRKRTLSLIGLIVSVTNDYNTSTDPVSFFRIYVQGAPE